jgi:hypothetical protein
MTTTAFPSQLDRFIPLAKAARRLKVSEKSLQQMILAGHIKGAMLPNGEIGVSESGVQVATINERLRGVRRENYKHLCGHPISVAEAAKRYNVPMMTIRSWMQRSLVAVIESGYGAKLDESDVAYCAAIYQIRKETGSLSGAPLLDEKGAPYELKNLWLAEYRRKKKPAL